MADKRKPAAKRKRSSRPAAGSQVLERMLDMARGLQRPLAFFGSWSGDEGWPIIGIPSCWDEHFVTIWSFPDSDADEEDQRPILTVVATKNVDSIELLDNCEMAETFKRFNGLFETWQRQMAEGEAVYQEEDA